MKAYIGKEYIQLYLDYLEQCGADVKASRWMANHKDVVDGDSEFVPFFLIRELRKEFNAITNQPMFAFDLGNFLGENLNTHLEYTLKTCTDMEEIAELSTKFSFIRSNVLTPKYKIVDGQIEFEIFNEFEENEYWLPMLFSAAALTFRFFTSLFGEGHNELFSLSVAEKEPDYFPQIKHNIPYAIKFNALRNCICIDSSALQLINPAEDHRLKLLLMASVQKKSERVQMNDTLRYQIRDILSKAAPNYPNMEEVASLLHVSKRTLARKLQAEKTSFLKILDEIRLEQAQRYLEQGLTINEIANQLGYESSASFINLFKKHTGKTPHEYRKS